jgi:hypothetical protein
VGDREPCKESGLCVAVADPLRKIRKQVENKEIFSRCAGYQGKKRTPADRWDYCQSLLDQIVTNFETMLTKEEDQRATARATKIARQEKRRKRKKVRQLTIAARSET